MHCFAAAAPSRFAGIGRWPGRLIILLLLLLAVQGLVEAPLPGINNSGHGDLVLQQRVIENVRAGGDYHRALIDEHRGIDSPAASVAAVRLPTLAWIHAALPPLGPAILLYMIMAATLGAWSWRLSLGGMPLHRAALGSMLLLSAAATLLLPDLLVSHECWSALLIALSLALRSDERWGLAALAALAAATMQEQAILLAVVMLAFALRGRRLAEAGAWSAVIGTVGLFLAWHAAKVAAGAGGGEEVVAGTGSGWAVAVDMIQGIGPARLMPDWAGAIMLPIALIGWAGWSSSTGVRGTAFLFLCILLLAAFAPDRSLCSAFLVAPLVPIGLLLAPRALSDLLRASLRRHVSAAGQAPLST